MVREDTELVRLPTGCGFCITAHCSECTSLRTEQGTLSVLGGPGGTLFLCGCVRPGCGASAVHAEVVVEKRRRGSGSGAVGVDGDDDVE